MSTEKILPLEIANPLGRNLWLNRNFLAVFPSLLRVRSLIWGVWILYIVLFGQTPAFAMERYPSGGEPSHVTLYGRPLTEALPTLSKIYGVKLKAEGELANQRVTVVGQDFELGTLARGLETLLSVNESARVDWHRKTSGWILRENFNRRVLASELRSQRLAAFAEHLDGELHWLEEVRKIPADKLVPSKIINGLLIPGNIPSPRRKAEATLLEAIGVDGRAKLLTGQPVVLRIADGPEVGRGDLINLLTVSTRQQTNHRLEDFRITVMLAGNPADAQNTYLVRSLVSPDGETQGRFSMLRMKGARRTPFIGPPFRLPGRNAQDGSKTVRFSIPPLPSGARDRTYRWLNLDTCLALLQRQTKLRFIADGYIRPCRAFVPTVEARDLPIEQLLTILVRQWNCDWQWLDPTKSTVLVRSRSWWTEDVADVPDSLLSKYRQRLSENKQGSLSDLLELAELNFGQVHKLVESGLCPQASGVVVPAFYELTGPKPCLQFYNRLPEPLKARVREPEGLPLAEAPRALVEEWLGPTLITHVGAITRQERERVALYLAPTSPEAATYEGRWILGFRPLTGGSSLWHWRLQPDKQPFGAVPDPLSELLEFEANKDESKM